MSLPREQKKSQPPLSDLAIFAGAILFLGVSLHSLLASRQMPHAMVPALVPIESATPERTPASQISAPSTLTTQVLRLPCLKSEPQVVSSHAHLVQIQSPVCSPKAQASPHWHASNATSGEEIMVFVNRQEKTLSTSYFTLREGRNDLVFVEDLGSGRAERHPVQITRKAE